MPLSKLIPLLLLTLLSSALLPAAENDVVRVFLFAGQSNMEGGDARTDRIDEFPNFKGAGDQQDGILYQYMIGRGPEKSEGWIPLRPHGKIFGPELTFARTLRQNQVQFPIAIIKSAVGGTTAAVDWNPDGPEEGLKLYPRTLKLVREALADLDRKGVKYRLEGVMWHQGENDMLNGKLNVDYGRNLKRIVEAFRRDLNAPDLKWYIGEISEKGIWGMDHRRQMSIVRIQQRKLVAEDPNMFWVPTSHLAFEVMGKGQPHYHFGPQGQLQHGVAYAEAWLKNNGGEKAKPPAGIELPFRKGAKVRLVVLAGQRNMEGEDAYVLQLGDVKGYKAQAATIAAIPFRYSLGGGVRISRGWQHLHPPRFLGNFGPELGFGAEIVKRSDKAPSIAIVKFTHSGAQMPDWRPDGSKEAHRNLYPKFIAFLKEARESIEKKGCHCEVDAVFWHAGENDTWFHPYASNYGVWMKELIDRTRTDLAAPQLKWFLSEQHEKSIWKNIDLMNGQLREVAKGDDKVFVIPTADLPHERLHFGTEGTLKLGAKMAKAWLKER